MLKLLINTACVTRHETHHFEQVACMWQILQKGCETPLAAQLNAYP